MTPSRRNWDTLSHWSKAVELKDIGWALAGIAVDAVGIVVQLCA